MALLQLTDQQERFTVYLRERYNFGPMPSHDLQALVAALGDSYIPGRLSMGSDAELVGVQARCFSLELRGEPVSSTERQEAYVCLMEAFLRCLQQRIDAGMVVHDSDGQYRSGFFLIPTWFVEQKEA